MSTFFKKYKRKNQSGFSLVELMVVVAIIGILAAIAIPSYQKFQRKARQSEAKIGLSGIHTSLTAFAAEWGAGTPNLLQMGYSPEGQLQYNIGWTATQQNAIPATMNINSTTRPGNYRGPLPVTADITKINTFITFPGRMVFGADESIGTDTTDIPVAGGGSCSHSSCTTQADCVDTTNACTGGTVGTWTPTIGGSNPVDNTRLGNPSYIIGAAGNIGGGVIDRWTMDSTKTLTNVVNGTE